MQPFINFFWRGVLDGNFRGRLNARKAIRGRSIQIVRTRKNDFFWPPTPCTFSHAFRNFLLTIHSLCVSNSIFNGTRQRQLPHWWLVDSYFKSRRKQNPNNFPEDTNISSRTIALKTWHPTTFPETPQSSISHTFTIRRLTCLCIRGCTGKTLC